MFDATRGIFHAVRAGARPPSRCNRHLLTNTNFRTSTAAPASLDAEGAPSKRRTQQSPLSHSDSPPHVVSQVYAQGCNPGFVRQLLHKLLAQGIDQSFDSGRPSPFRITLRTSAEPLEPRVFKYTFAR